MESGSTASITTRLKLTTGKTVVILAVAKVTATSSTVTAAAITTNMEATATKTTEYTLTSKVTSQIAANNSQNNSNYINKRTLQTFQDTPY